MKWIKGVLLLYGTEKGMRRTIPTKSSYHIIAATSIIFMVLNAFLPLNLPLKAEAMKYPFKLSMTMEKWQSTSGELVNVTWTLTNIGDESIVLYHSVDYFDFTIFDANFDHVFHYGDEITIDLDYYPYDPLQPGNKTGWKAFWDETYDHTGNVKPELRHKKVPPGVYYLVGSFNSPTYTVSLQAPPIRITIKGG